MPDAAHRRAVPEDAIFRQPADGGLPDARGGIDGEPQACATVDAVNHYDGPWDDSERLMT